MDNAKYMDLIGRYLSGGLEPAEKEQLMAWVEQSSANRKLFDELIQVWSISGRYEDEPFQADVESAWLSLENKMDQQAAQTTTRHAGARIVPLWQPRKLLRYAAAIALLLAAGYWALNRSGAGSEVQMVEIGAGAGERREVALPDGSRVILNENTRLAYAEPFEERRVLLWGEAFFEVEKMNGKPFAIEAEGATTTVLGTSFNVRAYPGEGEVKVSVRTGKVALEQSGNAASKVLLEPGESAVFIKAREVVEEVAISNADAWKNRQLDFNSVRLEEVVEAVERFYGINVEVVNPQLLNCRFNGLFAGPESLGEVWAAMDYTMGLRIEKKNNVYYISGDASRCQ